MMRKAILQNQMGLDILTVAQGGMCAIIKTEHWVSIPDNSASVSSALHDLCSQVKAVSDSATSLMPGWHPGSPEQRGGKNPHCSGYDTGHWISCLLHNSLLWANVALPSFSDY